VTPLPLTRPLAGILDACRKAGRPLSQRDLGERRSPRVSQAAVGDAVRVGDGIALANLAAYARAAGYVLWIGGHAAPPEVGLRHQVCDGHTMSVAEARALLDGWGLEMVLTVEEM
jgi:hypothetical protein